MFFYTNFFAILIKRKYLFIHKWNNNNNTNESTIYFLILHRLSMLEQNLNFLNIIAVFSHDCFFVCITYNIYKVDRIRSYSNDQNFSSWKTEEFTSLIYKVLSFQLKCLLDNEQNFTSPSRQIWSQNIKKSYWKQ